MMDAVAAPSASTLPITGAGGYTSPPTATSPRPGNAGCNACTDASSDGTADATTTDADVGGVDAAPPPSPGKPLEGMRLDMHCGAQVGTTDSCKMDLPGGASCPGEGYQWSRVVVFGGSPSLQYWVKLRFRGIVEPKVYAGGVADIAGSNGRFYQGGSPGGDPVFNEYGFTVSSPGQSYFINNWMEGDYVIALDYTETVLIKGGAKVTLYAFSKLCAEEYDCADLSKAPNCEGKPLAGITHLPDKGQFVQIDVESVSVAPVTAKPGLQQAAL